MTERKRYSDEELMEFKDLILQKMEVARSDYDQIVAALTHRDNNSVDDTSPTYKVTEEGYATQSKEELNTLATHPLRPTRNAWSPTRRASTTSRAQTRRHFAIRHFLHRTRRRA